MKQTEVIEIGEYIRGDNGQIGILSEISQVKHDNKFITWYLCKNNLFASFQIQDIVAHSFDLKKILFEGDIILKKDDTFMKLEKGWESDFKLSEIHRILTKESFYEDSYRYGVGSSNRENVRGRKYG